MGRRRKIEPIRKEDANKKDPGERRRGSYQGGREGGRPLEDDTEDPYFPRCIVEMVSPRFSGRVVFFFFGGSSTVEKVW